MRTLLRSFLMTEAAGGIILIVAASAAMIVANSPLAPTYFELLHAKFGPLSLLHWINDALMALFFLLVGLEIKREFLRGHLSRWSDRVLPCIAAAAGMVVPALFYLSFVGGMDDLARGWAIPTATDIAFAIGVLALLGSRAPASLKLFLTTIAIVDDMGAVAIIALAYTASISGPALLATAVILAVMVGLGRLGVRMLWPYLLLAALLWLAVLLSGVHATIAGVLAALAIPLGNDDNSPLERLEHRLHPWVAFAIVPLFGFANAGVSFGGIGMEQLLAPLPLGIAAGLFLGKQIGIFGSVRLAVALGLAQRPAGAGWTQVYGVALLCGIGFTMSLFIGGLAFRDPLLVDEVKIGVLGGSILSAIGGYVLLRWSGGKK
ncbi:MULTISPECIES: Na+/H+ antiporter NhaA [unclassified Sphingomonas]|uniref:Na+/H+ antiporter NhaA n=1 Tax=unclassified Sphingomonas TaxID=196159 RepID=UPI0006F4F73C|nr:MULTISPECIES: Na+/H+ antiporter NhaA [unclassified Sphingomonas]KQX17924.1 sodium:proton antiporter [Sphingomonas sp. Root1294]KQY70849.1 sodium:proton antiporter [Sphingomonas sp. Root50]KRB91657.1 sodium:proton antiporter [Sphingomonas sp. Root720]